MRTYKNDLIKCRKTLTYCCDEYLNGINDYLYDKEKETGEFFNTILAEKNNDVLNKVDTAIKLIDEILEIDY